MNQNNNRRGLYIYLAVLMAVVFLAMSWFNSTTGKKGVEYNKIVAEFLTDQVGEYLPRGPGGKRCQQDQNLPGTG